MPKSAGTEIFHSTGQTKTGSETVLITLDCTKLFNFFEKCVLNIQNCVHFLKTMYIECKEFFIF